MISDTATQIAIAGLQFIADDGEQLSRFVSLSGIEPAEIRILAQSPEFLVAILDYFLGDEPTLLSFAASADIDPADVLKAKHTLVPTDQDDAW